MGLTTAPAKLLLLEALRRPLGGNLLTLGRQDIWVSHRKLQEIAAEVGVRLAEAKGIALSHKPSFAKKS